MNKSSLIPVLLGMQIILALASLYLCYTYTDRVKELRSLQREAGRLNAKNQGLVYLFNDATEYGKTHPAIEPLLQTIRAKATPPAASALPGASKPGTK